MSAGAVPGHIPAARVVDLDVYDPAGADDDFHHRWRALQAELPDMVWTRRNEGHWIAMGGAALAEVQSDSTRFSSRVIVLPKSIGEQHKLIPTTIDPPEHRPYRLLLNAALSPATVRSLEPAIRASAIDLIEAFIADERCNFTRQYAEILPIRIFLALVDLPEADAGQIRQWVACITRPNPPIPFAEALGQLLAYLDPVIAARRHTPRDDMLSRMIAEGLDGRQLSHADAVSLCTQVLIAGVDTVVNMLGYVMAWLAQHPETRVAIASHPPGIRATTNELFRRFGLVTVAREVRTDIDFHGVALKAGEMVAVPTALHGLDERLNPDPLAVDFDRRTCSHSAFGSGPHRCPGQELARTEVAITIEEWLRRIPDFSLAADTDLSFAPGIVASLRRVMLQWPGQAQILRK